MTASKDGDLLVWNLDKPETGAIRLSGHARGANTVDFHPVYQFIISGGEDNKVKIWPVSERRAHETESRQAHTSAILKV